MGAAVGSRVAYDALTRREREVIELVSLGKPNLEIARELFLAEQTVKFHISNASRKLGAHTRGEAAAIAARRGLIHRDGACPLCGVLRPDPVIVVNGVEYVRASIDELAVA